MLSPEVEKKWIIQLEQCKRNIIKAEQTKLNNYYAWQSARLTFYRIFCAIKKRRCAKRKYRKLKNRLIRFEQAYLCDNKVEAVNTKAKGLTSLLLFEQFNHVKSTRISNSVPETLLHAYLAITKVSKSL